MTTERETMSQEDAHQRAADCDFDGAYVLAILYTLGYLGMVGALMFVPVPEDNRDILLPLIGIMSAVQLGIIKYYYDGSKGAEKAQTANIVRASRTDAVVQELAKTAPLTAAAAVAAASSSGVTNSTAPQTITTDNINVEADTATITQSQPTEGTK